MICARIRVPLLVLVLAAGPVAAQPKKADVSDRALADWVIRVSGLAAADQVTAIETKLAELNPDYATQKLTAVLKDGAVRELTLHAPYLRDIRPLKPLAGLVKLQMHGEPARPSRIADIACLRGMPLETLSLQHTAVADLSPLKGMQLKEVWCRYTPVKDIAVLKDMPIERLSVPAGVPPAQLDLFKGKVWRALVGDKLGLTPKRLAALFEKAAVENFHVTNDPALTSLGPLRGMPLKSVIVSGATGLKSLDPLAGAKTLGQVEVGMSQIEDLSPLAGVPVGILNLTGCANVKDLGPIADGKPVLYKLTVLRSGVKDLGPLARVASLQYLDASELRGLKSLAPLAKLTKLTSLYLTGTAPEDKDYTPLAGLPLETVAIDLNPKTVAVLKQIPTLKTVNGKPAATVLK